MTIDAGGRDPRTGHLSCPPEDHACGIHLLLAGGPDDHADLAHLLRNAPACSVGQVFVEVEGDGTPPPGVERNAPAGMGVTLLRRDRHGAVPHRHGEVLARAVTAWSDEWLAEDACHCAGPYALWVGYATSPDVEALCHRLLARFDAVPAHLHRPGDQVHAH